MFNCVFHDDLGFCCKVQARLKLKENAKSIFCPKRPVWYATLVLVDKKLGHLQQVRVILYVYWRIWISSKKNLYTHVTNVDLQQSSPENLYCINGLFQTPLHHVFDFAILIDTYSKRLGVFNMNRTTSGKTIIKPQQVLIRRHQESLVTDNLGRIFSLMLTKKH